MAQETEPKTTETPQAPIETQATQTDTAIAELVKSNEELIKKINYLETEAQKAYDKRDKSNHALKELKETKVETDTQEFNNIKHQLEDMVTQRDTAQTDFNNYKSDRLIQDEIQKIGISADAANPETFAILTELLKKDIKIEEGEIFYKNPDGTTQYAEGKAVNVNSRLDSIKNNTAYSGLFKPQVSNGSGSKASQGGTNTPDVSKLGYKEKGELIKRIGQEKYLDLVKVQSKSA